MTKPELDACLEPERLAAFLDGRLTGAERDAVLRHLHACEDCYETFSDLTAFREEEEPAGRVVEMPSSASPLPLWRVAAAAAVLVAVGAWTLLRPTTPDLPVRSAAELLAPLAPESPAGAGDLAEAAANPWRETPSALGFAPSGSAAGPSFRLGVALVDASAALGAGVRPAASRALGRASDAARALPRGAELRTALDAIGVEIDSGGELASALRGLTAAETLAEGRAEPGPFSLGRWLEAARLAALVENRAFFEQRELDAVLGSFAGEPGTEGKAAAAAVAEARRRIGAAEIDYEALAGELEELIRVGEEGGAP